MGFVSRTDTADIGWVSKENQGTRALAMVLDFDQSTAVARAEDGAKLVAKDHFAESLAVGAVALIEMSAFADTFCSVD